MATAMNCTVKTYKEVPLIKGGTEILYESGASAEGVLSGFLHKTYTEYYYTRENRGAIQVHDTIDNVEGCNYVSFQNISHGGKLFFGFIDHIDYINDNNTEIHFTIDPFPTYRGDAKTATRPYIVRNTPLVDTDYLNNEEDFDFFGKGVEFTELTTATFIPTDNVMLFNCDTNFSGGTLDFGGNTGIQYVLNPTGATAQQIIEAGGEILGVYRVPNGMRTGGGVGTDLSATLTFQGTHAKLKGGQYNKISVIVGSMAKEFDLMKFANKPTVSFRCKGIWIPHPVVVVYPLNYEGVAENTAEAIVVPFPSIPVHYSDIYSTPNAINNLKTIYSHTREQTMTDDEPVVMGRSKHQEVRNGRTYQKASETESYRPLSFGDTLFNLKGVVKNIRKSAMPSAGINASGGNIVLNNSGNIIVSVVHSHHYQSDLEKLDWYFDYFGYSVNAFGYVNARDKDYLQTGQEYFYGSEVDDVLNEMVMRGIKIRRTLTNPEPTT